MTTQQELKLSIATRLTEVFYKRWALDFWHVDTETYDDFLFRHDRFYSAYLYCSKIAYPEYHLAVVATSSPDSAILANAVVETVQGTTYFCSGKNYCICDFGSNDEPRTCVPSFPRVIPQSDSYQSIIESIPLSAYQDINWELDRVGG